MTPDAVSRPYALPPESTIAWTCCTILMGLSRSVSRVPGAEPRTSTPAVAPASHRMTVHPVGRALSVKWPTLIPPTSVRLPGGSQSVESAGAASAVQPAAKAIPIRSRLLMSHLRPLSGSHQPHRGKCHHFSRSHQILNQHVLVR